MRLLQDRQTRTPMASTFSKLKMAVDISKMRSFANASNNVAEDAWRSIEAAETNPSIVESI